MPGLGVPIPRRGDDAIGDVGPGRRSDGGLVVGAHINYGMEVAATQPIIGKAPNKRREINTSKSDQKRYAFRRAKNRDRSDRDQPA
jgi:hypothetical protein